MTSRVLFTPHMVLCPECYVQLKVASADVRKLTFIHPDTGIHHFKGLQHPDGRLDCSKVGHKFTIDLPELQAVELLTVRNEQCVSPVRDRRRTCRAHLYSGNWVLDPRCENNSTDSLLERHS